MLQYHKWNVTSILSVNKTLKQVQAFNQSSPWIWKGVSATLQSDRYTISYPRGRISKLIFAHMMCTEK